MDPIPKSISAPLETFEPHLRLLKRLYAAMDQAYRETATLYGFICNGCEDSCCRTRFYHFTFIEYLYLLEGYMTLGPSLRREVQKRAEAYRRHMDTADKSGLSSPLFCPLNEERFCILYGWRPMLCRLHGIPHELHTPGKAIFRGSGCHVFDRTCGQIPYIPFDRTPFYRDLAAYEQNLRKEIGADYNIKMTVAEMLLDFEKKPKVLDFPTHLCDIRKRHEIF